MSVQIIYELNILWKGKSIKMLHQKAFQPNVHSLKLTFWSDFSFSSKFLVAVSRLVWVCDNSFSSCCIFFSNASTSSLAFLWFFYRVIWRFMKMDGDKVGKKGKKREKLIKNWSKQLTTWRALSFSSSVPFAFMSFSCVESRSFSTAFILFCRSRTSSSA